LNRVNLDQKNFFYGTITQMNDGSLQAEVRGYNQQAYPTDYIRRTLRVNYAVEETANTVFDFGVASKGPLSLQGNILVTDVNVSVEMNAYIESYNDILAFSIQNSQVGGEVKIVNPLAMVSIQGGHASVGGESGSDAMKHIKIGEKAVQFPKPDPTVFSGYAQTPFTDSSATGALIVNRRIPPNTNPKFSGTTTIRGVMYIEQPNVVEFAGGVDITGVIVTDGSRFDDSGANKIIFGGSVGSASVSDLPDEAQYAGLHKETGTFIMAPGFALSFTGSFGTLSGAIIGNGITFSGSAGGTIKGSVINYANNTMELTGSTDLFFNRSGLEELPAGFVPEIKLVFKPDTYSEPMLSSIGLVGIEG
jgi:hypothetical protein